MNTPTGLPAQFRAVNQTAAFNQWCGIEIVSAEPGKVEIACPGGAMPGETLLSIVAGGGA